VPGLHSRRVAVDRLSCGLMSCFCRASKLSPIQTVQARCSRPPELWSHVLLLPLTLQGCVPLTCPPAHLPSLSQPSQLKGSASAEVAAKEWRTQVVTPAGGKAQARQSTSHVQQQVGGGGGTTWQLLQATLSSTAHTFDRCCCAVCCLMLTPGSPPLLPLASTPPPKSQKRHVPL
jgi:hypothetical protein